MEVGNPLTFYEDFEIHEIWSRLPLLIWSNSGASDSQRIRAALVNPRFYILLEIALVFGTERLAQEWSLIESLPEARRVADICNRCIKHIREGEQLAYAEECGGACEN